METSSTVRDAAIVLRQLPRPQAAQVMSRIGARELNAIFQEIDRLNSTSTEEVATVLNRAVAEVDRLERGQPKRPKFQELEDASQRQPSGDSDNTGSPFGFLLGYNPDLVDQVIRDEHPKHIASVLAGLPPEVASAQLRRLDSVQRVAVVKRICELENQPAADCSALASALKKRLNKILVAHANAPKSGVSNAAQLLQYSEPVTQGEIFTGLAADCPELPNELSSPLLQFGDLASFSEADMKVLLRSVDTGLWAPALHSAPLGVRHKVLNNMAPKAARILVDEIKRLRCVTTNESRAAQQKIMAACAANALPLRSAD
jgi:flagellar motor switch protein FliG